MVPVWSDELWVEQWKAGQPQAFEELIKQYQGYVFAIVLRFTSGIDDAQDIAQEVFLQVYRSLPTFQADHLKAWIGRIAVNKAIDWKRRQNRAGREPDIFRLSELDLKDQGLGLDEMIISQEQGAAIRRLCDKLPGHYKRVLTKYHFQNKSYRDIAREEGISVKTVETRLYRARKLLRRQWEEAYE